MQSALTRRTIVKSAALGGIAGIVGHHAPMAAAQSDINSGGIGLTRADWEANTGQGTDAGNVTAYTNPERPGFPVLAQFDGSNRVTHLEFVYTDEGSGGLPENDVSAQVDSAMPLDAELVETFSITRANREATQYRAERYTSEQLGAMSNGLASILVVWQQQDVGPEPVVTRVSLTMPGPHTMEARDVGNPGGIGLSRPEWDDLYGQPEAAQGGMLYENEVVPEFQLMVQFKPDDRANLVNTATEGELPPAVAYTDAKLLVGSLLPEDAILRYVFFVPSTPERMVALSAELWECPSLAGITDDLGSALALYEQATDTDPVTVSRLAVTLPIDPNATSGATPTASPAS